MGSLLGDMINMSKLKRLGLFCAKIVKNYSRFCEFQNLVTLQLHRCNMLEELSDLHKLKGLRQLYIYSCSKLKKFPIEFSEKGTYPTTIYGSPTDAQVRAIIDLAPKTCVTYCSVVYILHLKILWSTIRPHIGTWSTFGPQIVY